MRRVFVLILLGACSRTEQDENEADGGVVVTGLELDTGQEHDTEGHGSTEAAGDSGSTTLGASTGAECQLTDQCLSDADCPDALQSCIGCMCVTDGEAIGDPVYPNPAGGCGDAFDGNSVAQPPINTCMPACDTTAPDIYGACPAAVTGTGRGACLVASTQGSSDTPCSLATVGQACATPGEYCYTTDGAAFVCRVGAYCLVSCSSNETCPDGMSCDASGRCQY